MSLLLLLSAAALASAGDPFLSALLVEFEQDGTRRTDHGLAALYEQACKAGTTAACQPTRWRDADGYAVPKRIIEELSPACDDGVAAACMAVAWMETDGPDVDTESWERGRQRFAALCDSGLHRACAELGAIMVPGHTAFGEDREQAISLLTAACDAGEGMGCGALGWVVDADGDPGLFQRGCDLGDAWSCVNLGDQLAFKQSPPDVLAARELYREACGLSHPRGCRDAARLNLHERWGAIDIELGLSFAARACRLRQADGCLLVGHAMELTDRTDPLVPDAFETGCDLGSAASCSRWADALIGQSHPAAERLQAFEAGCALEDVDACQMAAVMHFKAQRFEQAIVLSKRSVALAEAQLGPDHLDTAQSLSNLGHAQQQLGLYEPARVALSRAETIYAAAGPEAIEQRIAANRKLADIDVAENDLPGAHRRLARGATLCESNAGIDLWTCATVYNSLGMIHDRLGELEPGLVAYARALDLAERSEAPASEIISMKVNAASLRLVFGDVPEAITQAESAVASGLELLGDQHSSTLAAMDLLARALIQTGETQEPRRLLTHVVEVRSRTLGPLHERTLINQTSLGAVLLAAGEVDAALVLLDDVESSAIAKFGEDHPTTVDVKGMRATVLVNAGRAHEAVVALRDVTVWQIENLGPTHPNTLITRANLAAALVQADEPAQARALLKPLLDDVRATLNQSDPRRTSIENTLAVALQLGGLHAEAQALMESTLEWRETNLGGDASMSGTAENNLGLALLEQGDVEAAVPHLEQAIEVFEAQHGPHDARLVQPLVNLAAARAAAGEYVKAVALLDRASKVSSATHGFAHPTTARVFNQLGYLNHTLGNRRAARLALSNAYLAIVRADMARSRDAAIYLVNLTEVEESLGHTRLALGHSFNARGIEDEVFRKHMWAGTADQRARTLESLRYGLDVSLSLHLLQHPRRKLAAIVAFQTVLRRKGRQLDVETGIVQAGRAGGTSVALAELSDATTRLATLRLHDFSEDSQEVLTATQRLADAQADLAGQSVQEAGVATDATARDIAAVLPPGAVLIEFVRYRAFPVGSGSVEYGAAHYGAYTLDGGGKVRWADLGESDIIDERVASLRDLMQSEGAGWEPEAAALSRTLFGRLARSFRSAKSLVISPDGALALAPWAVLVPKLDATTPPVTLVTSGRELMEPSEETSGGPALILADVEYGEGSGWQALAATRTEGLMVQRALPDATLLTGPEATEQALRSAVAPSVLHVASHGFFRGASSPPAQHSRAQRLFDPEATLPSSEPNDVLYRSGLVLAGANDLGPDDPQDGLMSAAEVALLDLRGTKLVVLSACETGVGGVQDAEGVLGLRHALNVAGAESQLLTLWEVDDAATSAFMGAFYGAVGAGESRAEAVVTAMEAVGEQERWAHPRFWAGFVLYGAPE